MKTFKTLLFLVVSALTLPTWAQTVHIYSIAKGVAVGEEIYAGPLYTDETATLQGEKVAVIIAQHQSRTTKDDAVHQLFKVDKAGQILLTDEGTSAISSFEVFMNNLNANGTIGETFKLSDTFYPNDSYLWEIKSLATMDTKGEYSVVYLFRFDSRYYNSSDNTFAAGIFAQSWGGVKIAEFSNLPGPSMGGGNFKQILLDLDYTTAAYTRVDNPMLAYNATSVESITVEGKTYSGAELNQYLMPTFTEVSLDTDGSLILTSSSNDVIVYTLETTDSLETPNWKLMNEVLDEVLKNLSDEDKNNLANQSEKCYTCLRVKDSTQIKIPRLPNEIKRFYRLIAE